MSATEWMFLTVFLMMLVLSSEGRRETLAKWLRGLAREDEAEPPPEAVAELERRIAEIEDGGRITERRVVLVWYRKGGRWHVKFWLTRESIVADIKLHGRIEV